MTDFSALFDKYIESQRRDRAIKKNEFHPSSISSDCLRKIFYSQLIKSEWDKDTQRVFRMGTLCHREMYYFLKWCGEKYDNIEFLSDEKGFRIMVNTEEFVYIKGSADFIIKIDGKLHIIEAKSTKSLAPLKHGANKAHKEQLNTYLWGLGIEDGLILYIEKNTLQFKIFPIQRDRGLFETTLGKINKVWQYILDKEVPPRVQKSRNKYPCTYCGHRNLCIKDFNPSPPAEKSDKNDDFVLSGIPL